MAGRPAAAHGRMGGFSRVSETLSSAVASTRGPLWQTNALALAGCELSGHTRSFTFKVEEEDDTEHVLGLNMVRDRRVVGDAGRIHLRTPRSRHPRIGSHFPRDRF